MKKLAGLVAMILATALTLTSCGIRGESGSEAGVDTSQEQDKETEEIKDLVIARLSTQEIQTFNILYS